MAVTQVSASAAITSSGVIHGLIRRQSDTPFDPNDIPIQCKSQCAFISDTLSRCQAKPSLGCDCNVADETAFITCLNCILALAPSQSLTDEAQGEVNNYVAACAAAGFPVPATRLAGSTPTPSVTRVGGISATGATGITPTQNTFQPASTPESSPGPADPMDPLSQSLFQPVPSSGGGSGSNNNGPLPGMRSAASRAGVGFSGLVLGPMVYMLLF
ncbi:hypothetical protein BDZ94DRAFT_1305137 [Collybia nuda]|uniref:Uncharacterized protein n=1 Tax=Collybia nuda TaxID=64659 RepID=A0A9P5YEP4_9AGAR|nr:hypothetical protein BDZ94DRAFT_1305137 [Collybia nuda]